jgi:hypothetical protein
MQKSLGCKYGPAAGYVGNNCWVLVDELLFWIRHSQYSNEAFHYTAMLASKTSNRLRTLTKTTAKASKRMKSVIYVSSI